PAHPTPRRPHGPARCWTGSARAVTRPGSTTQDGSWTRRSWNGRAGSWRSRTALTPRKAGNHDTYTRSATFRRRRWGAVVRAGTALLHGDAVLTEPSRVPDDVDPQTRGHAAPGRRVRGQRDHRHGWSRGHAHRPDRPRQ